MRVLIPSPLRSYTGGATEAVVESPPSGSSLAEVLARLDARFPGIRFRVVDEQGRIRDHVRFFVGTRLVHDLAVRVGAGEDVHVIASLSGG